MEAASTEPNRRVPTVARRVASTLAAFVSAVLAAAVGVTIVNAWHWGGLSRGNAVSVFFLYCLVAAVPVLVFGLPSFLALRWLGAMRWWPAAATGAVVGAINWLRTNPRGPAGVAGSPGEVLCDTAIGALAAIVFLWVWRQGDPLGRSAAAQRRRSALAVAVLVGALLLAAVVGTVNFQNIGADGQVVDLLSKQPIAGAEVTLQCVRQKPVHGSETLRSVSTVASTEGRFAFDFKHTWDCHDVFVRASKAGYVGSYIFHSRVRVEQDAPRGAVPRFVFLVREPDAVRLELDGLLQDATNVAYETTGQPVTDATWLYAQAKASFSGSILVAKQADDIRWVREHYCERLSSLWSRMSPAQQREHLAQHYSSSVASPADIEAYCR